MKFRSLLSSFIVALITLTFGLAWVGVYQYFLGQSNSPMQEEVVEVKTVEKMSFNIDDPESVLPLNFEEDKLTSPHDDETNEAEFDPEGYYSFVDAPEGFDEFHYIAIENKNFDVAPKDKRYGDLVSPRGFVVLQNSINNDVEYIDFSKVSIGNAKIQVQTEIDKGISYEFSGEFLVKGNFYTLDENTEVLKGTLVKKKNGEIIASSDVKLKWSLEIGCLH